MNTNVYIGSNPIYKQYIGNSYSETNIKSYDVNTLDFITATGISNIGVVDAIDVLVKDLKNNSLWDYMDAIYPLVSDNTSSLDTQFKYNLKDTGSFTLTFVNGVNGDLNGYKSDSNSPVKYANTGYVPTTERNAESKSLHLSVYTTDLYNTLNPTFDAYDIGGVSGIDYTFLISGRSYSDPNTSKFFGVRNSLIGVTNAAEAGFCIGTYDGITNDMKLFLNNTQLASGTSGTTRDISPLSLFFGANNNGGNPGQITNKKYQFMSLGGFIPSGSISTYTTIVQTFQETIDSVLGTSRAV